MVAYWTWHMYFGIHEDVPKRVCHAAFDCLSCRINRTAIFHAPVRHAGACCLQACSWIQVAVLTVVSLICSR